MNRLRVMVCFSQTQTWGHPIMLEASLPVPHLVAGPRKRIGPTFPQKNIQSPISPASTMQNWNQDVDPQVRLAAGRDSSPRGGLGDVGKTEV